MTGFFLRIVINAVILFLAIINWPGIFVDTLGAILIIAALLGLVNAMIRPVLTKTALPFNIITLAGFTIIINVFISVMAINTLPGFVISSIVTSFMAIILMSALSFTLTMVIQDR